MNFFTNWKNKYLKLETSSLFIINQHVTNLYKLRKEIDKLTSLAAEGIRNNNNIMTWPANLETYQWKKRERMNNKKMRKYNYALRGVSKDIIEITETNHDALVVYIYQRYKVRIKGL